MDEHARLSRRERQIMDIVYARGEASAAQVLEDMHDPPTRTAVRTLLRILEGKGHLEHRKEGREHIYHPTKPRESAGRSALRRVLDTFYGGSLEEAVAAHLTDPKGQLQQEDLKRLMALVRDAREEE